MRRATEQIRALSSAHTLPPQPPTHAHSHTHTTADVDAAHTMNQLVRWVTNKDTHADRIIHTVAVYCLAQRVKVSAFASEHEYTDALTLHHAVMLAAVKCKQSASIEACDVLDSAIAQFSQMYLPVRAAM